VFGKWQHSGIVIGALALCSGCASNVGNMLAELEQYDASVELTDVPFHPQVTDQCGPAALATVLNNSDIPVSPEELRSRVYIPGRPAITAASRTSSIPMPMPSSRSYSPGALS
jgi:hypothetical protein